MFWFGKLPFSRRPTPATIPGCSPTFKGQTIGLYFLDEQDADRLSRTMHEFVRRPIQIRTRTNGTSFEIAVLTKSSVVLGKALWALFGDFIEREGLSDKRVKRKSGITDID